MILEEKLITLRKSQGLSQDDLANKLDISRQAVYKWETGQALPDISKLKILSTLYNVSIDNLLNNNEDIIYMNAPKSHYGKVVVKKSLDDEAAENDNTKLFPDEQKKLKTRKTVLGIFKAINIACLVLAIAFFILAVMASMEQNEVKLAEHSSFVTIFLVALVIVSIVKGILGKIIYPKIQVAKTYYKQELERVTTELESKYSTVIRLQDDILAWFVFDSKTNSFGLYFDGEIQFLCPMSNYAGFYVTYLSSLYGVEIKYFDETGKLSSYKFTLSFFRQFWLHENMSIKNAKIEAEMLELRTKSILTSIKQRLDIEKDRIK